MKNKHVFWGVLLISLGLLILINNLTPYDFYYTDVIKLWPVVLILWGISMMIRQPAVRTFLVAITAVALAFAGYSTYKAGFRFTEHNFFFSYSDDEDFDESDYEVKNFNEEFSDQQRAVLNFDAGAGSFSFGKSDSYLFSAEAKGAGNNYTLDRSNNGNKSTIDFIMHRKRFSFREGKSRNEVKMNLHSSPVWDINLNVGAASLDLDFSSIKVNRLKIEMGAASLNAKLGEPETETHFIIDAGVSSIDIAIPENVGCEIKADVSLSTKNFEGFSEVRDDVYQTENFARSGKKIYIELDTGVSSINVKRTSNW